jgi:hypothetical protein
VDSSLQYCQTTTGYLEQYSLYPSTLQNTAGKPSEESGGTRTLENQSQDSAIYRTLSDRSPRRSQKRSYRFTYSEQATIYFTTKQGAGNPIFVGLPANLILHLRNSCGGLTLCDRRGFDKSFSINFFSRPVTHPGFYDTIFISSLRVPASSQPTKTECNYERFLEGFQDGGESIKYLGEKPCL